MARPAAGKVRVLWTPPKADPRVATWGHCTDYPFTDAQIAGSLNDPTDPVRPAVNPWVLASTANIQLVPELRGAIMLPMRLPTDCTDVANGLDPAAGPGTSWGKVSYYNADSYPDGDWQALLEESMGLTAAYYGPQLGWLDGWLVTKNNVPLNGSWILYYQLYTPQGSGDPTLEAGLDLYFGVRRNDLAAFRLHMPVPTPASTDIYNGQWTLFVGDYAAVETAQTAIPQPCRGSEDAKAQTSFEWIQLLFVDGRLLITSSRQPDSTWLYAPPYGTWPGVGQTGGITVREGLVGLNVYGLQGSFIWGRVLFPEEVTVSTPSKFWSSAYEPPNEAFVYVSPTDGLASAVSGVSGVGDYYHTSVTLVNGSDTDNCAGITAYRYTPALWKLVEISYLQLAAGEAADDIDLSSYVQRLEVHMDESGRGSRASVLLDNHGWLDDHYELGPLTSQLRGIGRVSIELAHVYGYDDADGEWVQVFTGYGTPTYQRPGMWPTITLELQDRSVLWGGSPPKTVMAELPAPGGHDMQWYARLALMAWEVPYADIVFPADYATLYPDWAANTGQTYALPAALGSMADKFSPGTGLMEALDAICEPAWMKWRVNRDNTVEFLWWPTAVAAPTWTVEDGAADVLNGIRYGLEHRVDLLDFRNAIRAWGRSDRGELVAAHNTNDLSVTDESDPYYTGRWSYYTSWDESDPSPGVSAARQLLPQLTRGRTLSWDSWGHDVWPGDGVTVTSPHLGIESGSVYVVVAKSIRVTPPLHLWEESYVAKPVYGGLNV